MTAYGVIMVTVSPILQYIVSASFRLFLIGGKELSVLLTQLAESYDLLGSSPQQLQLKIVAPKLHKWIIHHHLAVIVQCMSASYTQSILLFLLMSLYM